MKKITLLALSAFALMSCADDDGLVDNASVNGTWALTKIILDPSVAWDANGDGVISENHMDEVTCFNGSTITFGANNTAVFSRNCLSVTDGPETTTYGVAPSALLFTYNPIEYPDYSLTSTYIRQGNTLEAIIDFQNSFYVPGQGDNYDTDIAFFQNATFIYTKQ